MINHARTLLLNVNGSPTGFSGQDGDEFVPPDYMSQSFPEYLLRVHRAIFGSSPDRLMLNYRIRQLLGILHATELEEFVLSLDSRITYDVLPRDGLFSSVFIPTIQKLNGTATDLHLVGTVGPPDSAGRTRHSWRVNVTGASTVMVVRQTPPAESSVQEYTLTDGLSSLISLVRSGLQARFGAGVGAEWLVTAASRPVTELGAITSNLSKIGDDAIQTLFGAGSKLGTSEPYVTFRNLWRDHPEMPYRLGGLLLAWIYRADRVWQGLE